MKSIVAFVWCLLCLLGVASSRILRHEKTSIGAKETSRASTNEENILQDCLTEASGAGKTTRENQLTYFQVEFQRINTELKTVRDEMYADGGTDRKQRNLFNMNNLAECVLKDPKLLDIDGWDAFMTTYHDIKQKEVDKTDERNDKAYCIVLLMIQDTQAKLELSMDDDSSFSTSLSGWLKDLHTTPAAKDLLYPAMQRLVAKEDAFVEKETVLGKVMDGSMPYSAMEFINTVAPYAVAKSTPKIALSQFLGMGFGGATETALNGVFDWSEVYGAVFDEVEGIAHMSTEDLNKVPSEMEEWYNGYGEQQKAGDTQKAADSSAVEDLRKRPQPGFDADAFDSEAFKDVAGNTLVIYGIYSSISGLVSNPKSVEGWLTMGSTVADVSDMIAEGTGKLMSHMKILKTVPLAKTLALVGTFAAPLDAALALYELFSSSRYSSAGSLVGKSITAVLSSAAAVCLLVPGIGTVAGAILGAVASLTSVLTNWFAPTECESRRNMLNSGGQTPKFSSHGLYQDRKMRKFIQEAESCEVLMERLMSFDGEITDEEGNEVDFDEIDIEDRIAPSSTTGYEKLQSILSVLMTGGTFDRPSFADKKAGLAFLTCVGKVDPTLYGKEKDDECDQENCPGCKTFKAAVDYLSFDLVMKRIEGHPQIAEEGEKLFSQCGFPHTRSDYKTRIMVEDSCGCKTGTSEDSKCSFDSEDKQGKNSYDRNCEEGKLIPTAISANERAEYIMNMVRGYTGNPGELAIMKLWKCATKEDQATMANSHGITYSVLRKNIHGNEWDEIKTCAETVLTVSDAARGVKYSRQWAILATCTEIKEASNADLVKMVKNLLDAHTGAQNEIAIVNVFQCLSGIEDDGKNEDCAKLKAVAQHNDIGVARLNYNIQYNNQRDLEAALTKCGMLFLTHHKETEEYIENTADEELKKIPLGSVVQLTKNLVGGATGLKESKMIVKLWKLRAEQDPKDIIKMQTCDVDGTGVYYEDLKAAIDPGPWRQDMKMILTEPVHCVMHSGRKFVHEHGDPSSYHRNPDRAGCECTTIHRCDKDSQCNTLPKCTAVGGTCRVDYRRAGTRCQCMRELKSNEVCRKKVPVAVSL